MYDDFFDIGPNNKEMAALILAVFVFMVVVFSAGYCVGLRNAGTGGENVHDNGAGAAGVGQQIEQAGTDIQHAKEGIKEAEGTADKIGAGIESAKESAQYIHSTAGTSTELISECQSIIAGIRARGQAAKTKD